MNVTNQRRRDWSIIIFILPLGVVMMMCVGQLAIRMAPDWSVSGDMNSSLDPETAGKQDALIIPPVSSGILTPMSWWDTFLTPSGEEGGGVVFPPFITFEPSLTPTSTNSPTTTSTVSVTPTSSLTLTPTPPTSTPTKKPTDDDSTPTPPTTCQNPTASNFGGALPCTFPPGTCTDPLANNNGGALPCLYTPTPPTTCTDPLANNNGGALPCLYTPTPPTTCTDPNATNTGGPLPCTYPVPVSSTLEGSPSATPVGVTNPPDGDVAGNNVSNIPDGYYVIITLPTPIIVIGISETNYDFVYYERQLDNVAMPPSGGVQMDRVILSISTAVNGTYYQIFNWGNGIADNNSNLGDVAGTEDDNQSIPASEFYGTYPQDTGVLIDVDNAPSHPPPGNYSFLAIQAPVAPPAGDGADVDAVEVVEVPP